MENSHTYIAIHKTVYFAKRSTLKRCNIKIDNKDHTININIKAKQKTIEDAWSN